MCLKLLLPGYRHVIGRKEFGLGSQLIMTEAQKLCYHVFIW